MIQRPENVHEIVVSSMGKLLLSGGEGAVRILKVGDCVFPGSFDDGLVEETGISVPSNRPVLFVSLSVISFIFSKNGLMLKNKVLLEAGVLLMRWAYLKVKNLILNGFELIRNFRFGFAPPLQIFGKVEGFKMEGTVKGFVPTLLGSIFIVILQEPPVLKLEWLMMIATSGSENR